VPTFSNSAAPARPTRRAVPATNTFHTIAEIADRLHCSVATVRRRIAAGSLRAVHDGRVVRISEADFQAYLRSARKGR